MVVPNSIDLQVLDPLPLFQAAECEKKRGGDSIYRFLAGELAGEGHEASVSEVLDAGTGLSSMCWLALRESRLYARRFAGVADPLTELSATGVFREL